MGSHSSTRPLQPLNLTSWTVMRSCRGARFRAYASRSSKVRARNNVSEVANFPMLNTKRPLGVDEAFASAAESASSKAANHALIAAIPDAALQPRGAPVVSPRIFKGVGFCADADPLKRSPRTTAAQNIRVIIYSGRA